MKTFHCSVDVFIFSLLWTGVLLSISHRKYNIPPSIVQEPEPSMNCFSSGLDDCEIGDVVSIYFKEEEPIQITCEASGRPDVTYKWTKDNVDFNVESSKRFRILSNSGTLLINNASRSDHGMYRCLAINDLGTSLSKTANVVFAINEVFKTVSRPEEISGNEGLPLSLKCKLPHVVPKPSVHWTNVGKYDTDAQLARVVLDDRIALDYEGTLHFANIRMSDIKENGRFICNMHNIIYRTYSEGEDKKVTVIKSLSGKMNNVVKLLWKSDLNVKGLKGGKAKFMCIFGGNQTPKITWRRKDKDMNERMKVTDAGHELIIKDLDISDSGYYECSGINDVTTTPVTVTFELKVEAVPYFIKEPTDQTIGVEEDAEFPCMVEGIPQPSVEWYINGKPIADAKPNPRRIIQKNSIIFKNVINGDSQVLQCKATNTYGSALTDVYLNVLALKPEITSGPGVKIVAEGKSVTLTCEHNGKPEPKLTWKKDIQPLNSDRYTFTHNTIVIKNATLSDDGKYSCKAINRFGSDEKEGHLTVRIKTEVTIHPVERVLKHGEGASFSCVALTDPAENHNLVVTWYKNGEEINDNDDDGNIKILDKGHSLSLVKTSSKDSGNYTCHADNGIDNASAISQLKVEAPPETPTDLGFKTCGGLKATLVWKPGFDNYLTTKSFHLYYKTNYDREYLLKENVTGNQREKETGLNPYANYTFKISAWNLLGESQISEATNVCSTKAAPPSYNPKNVKIIDDKTGKLVIEWDAIKPKEQNGPEFKYIIYTTHQKTGKKKSYEIPNWEQTRKEIDVDNTYEEYTIEVKAQNIKGDATKKSYVYRGHSGMGEPKVVPSNFEVDPDEIYSHETIGLMWDPVDTSDQAMQGKFNGYKIRYWDNGEPEKIKEIEIPPNSDNSGRNRRSATDKVRATVRLPPYSNLLLDVVARNTYFDSNASNVINITTPEGVPGPVIGLEALYRSGHFIKVKWQKPLTANGEITGYDVSYVEVNETSVYGMTVDETAYDVKTEPTWNEGKNHYELGIQGLELNTQYRVNVWARTSTGRGKKWFIDVKTALESVPTMPSIQEAVAGKTFINVSWEINKADVAGYYYFVEYRKYGEHEFKEGPLEKSTTWSVVHNLTAASTYEVQVVAKSGKYESRSPKKSVSTLGSAAVANAVYEATWFIIMMAILAVVLLAIIILCLVKRSRGDKYHVQEKEKLRGLESDEKKTAQYNGFNDNGETQPLAGSPDDFDRGPLESDKDSLEEYGDPDPSRFNEDGSFIGQYGAEKMTASEVAVPSAMHTFV